MSKQIEAAIWGRVVVDGELRTSAAGNDFGMVTLMADSDNQDDEGKDIPVFVKVFAFGPLASVAANLKKGAKAFAEGVLSCGIWQPESREPPRLDVVGQKAGANANWSE